MWKLYLNQQKYTLHYIDRWCYRVFSHFSVSPGLQLGSFRGPCRSYKGLSPLSLVFSRLPNKWWTWMLIIIIQSSNYLQMKRIKISLFIFWTLSRFFFFLLRNISRWRSLFMGNFTDLLRSFQVFDWIISLCNYNLHHLTFPLPFFLNIIFNLFILLLEQDIYSPIFKLLKVALVDLLIPILIGDTTKGTTWINTSNQKAIF